MFRAHENLSYYCPDQDVGHRPAIRVGAEGLFARRAGFLVGAIGAQTLLTDEDVECVRTLRRDEVPARPLVWQAAIRNLVAELTGRGEVAAR
jgi:hypothetical protein